MAHIPAGGRPTARPASVQRSFLCWLAATVVYVIGSVVAVAVTFGSAGRAAARDGSGVTSAVLTGTLIFYGIVVLVLAVLTVLFAVKMRAGRQWARITLTVFGVIFVLVDLAGSFGGGRSFTLNRQFVDTAGSSTISTIVSIITLLLLIAALVLQWLPDRADYFASYPPKRTPPPPGPPPIAPV